VVHHIVNPMRDKGYGISCYFPYSSKPSRLATFQNIGTSPAFGYYYEYALTGSLSQAGQDYLNSLSTPSTPTPSTPTPPTAPPLTPPANLGLDNHEIVAYGNGTYWLELGESAKNVAAIFIEVGAFEQGSSDFILFGTRHDLYEDWEFGLFRDEFGGYWGSLDGALCYMEAIMEGLEFIVYRVPVYHNGVAKDLIVSYNWKAPYFYEGSYTIAGLLTQNSLEFASSNPAFEELKVGDVVEPILFRFRSGSNWTQEIGGPGEPYTHPITVTNTTSFFDSDLGDGLYMIRFQIIDYSGTPHYSKTGLYKVEGGIFEPI